MSTFEIIINLSVITLLVLTIIYIWRLNRNINILRNNQESIASLAQSLNEASAKAENAVISLKAAAHETARNLHNIVEEAEQTGKSLNSFIDIDTSDNDQPKSEAELELIEALRALR